MLKNQIIAVTNLNNEGTLARFEKESLPHRVCERHCSRVAGNMARIFSTYIRQNMNRQTHTFLSLKLR